MYLQSTHSSPPPRPGPCSEPPHFFVQGACNRHSNFLSFLFPTICSPHVSFKNHKSQTGLYLPPAENPPMASQSTEDPSWWPTRSQVEWTLHSDSPPALPIHPAPATPQDLLSVVQMSFHPRDFEFVKFKIFVSLFPHHSNLGANVLLTAEPTLWGQGEGRGLAHISCDRPESKYVCLCSCPLVFVQLLNSPLP